MNQLKRTSALVIANFFVTGAGIGLLLQLALSGAGRAPFVPPLSLPITLLVLGALVLTLALRLRRQVTTPKKAPVNPFFAVRLLLAAKASTLIGALFSGLGVGMMVQFVFRTVFPSWDIWLPVAGTLVGGAVLAVCGSLAEYYCRIPPEDGEPEQEEGGSHVDQPA